VIFPRGFAFVLCGLRRFARIKALDNISDGVAVYRLLGKRCLTLAVHPSKLAEDPGFVKG
jgi:hypothetical protein